MALPQRHFLSLSMTAALAAFTVTAIAAAALVWAFEQDRYREERSRVADIASDQSQALQRAVEGMLSANYALAALVRQGRGTVRDYEAVADQMLPFYPQVTAMALAPGGIVRQVVPLAGNEPVLGFDLLSDARQGGEAMRARDSRRLTLTGPVPLVQGGEGVVGRLAVFLDDASGRPVFWGFTNVAARLADVLAAARLEQLQDRGLSYLLWRSVPGTGERQTIAASSEKALAAPVEHAVELPNGVWTLSVAPIRGWEPPRRLVGQSLLGLVFSLLMGYLVKVLVDLQLHRQQLASLVAQRTEEILATERRLKATLEALPDPLFEMDLDGTFLEYHMPRKDVLGPLADGLVGRRIADMAPPQIAGPVLQALQTAHASMWSQGTEVRLRLGQSTLWFELSVVRKQGDPGTPPRFILLARDVTERRRAERRVRRLAHYDPLTGLPNRVLLRDRVGLALAAARRSGAPVALAFIDLDHFKNINDSLGHRTGDTLLAALAQRLKATVREQDTFSRLGGDEFVLLLPDTDADGAAQVAAKLIAAAALPYQIGGHELTVTFSIGIAMHPGDGADFDTLYQHADAAAYRAKTEGRNHFCFFKPELQDRSVRTLQVENALRRALERGQLQLHYQPQIEMRSGRVVGAEALLRWQHPELGAVSPAEFIPLAEETGLIVPIGEWVLRTGANQLAQWLRAGMAPITLSVNLSAVQFRQPNLPELVAQVLADAGLQGSDLELELTESTAIANPRAAVDTMRRLQELGVRLSMDDFGTGYSSLNHLKRFKIHRLKIDQSFVRDLTVDADDDVIVSAILRMAQAMNIQTTAEGVETQVQVDFLLAQGCQEVQGYFFSRPLAVPAFEAFMAARSAAQPGPPPGAPAADS